jgi:hypothetical protein
MVELGCPLRLSSKKGEDHVILNQSYEVFPFPGNIHVL